MKLILLFALVIFINKPVISKSYENFKVYSLFCECKNDVETLQFWIHHPMIDFWNLPGVNRSANILINPAIESKFKDFLFHENFNYEVLIENVGRLSRQLHNFFSIHDQNFYFLPRSIRSHTRNKLKFHFPNGNFNDTFARDFSHYWTLPEVNFREKKIIFQSEIFLPFFNSLWRDFSDFSQTFYGVVAMIWVIQHPKSNMEGNLAGIRWNGFKSEN